MHKYHEGYKQETVVQVEKRDTEAKLPAKGISDGNP